MTQSNQMDIGTILDRIYLMPLTSKKILKDCMEEVKYSKGHALLRADKIEKNIYFIKKGIVRAYADNDGDDITFWFGQEGDLALSINGYVKDQKGYENIELLEDCEFFKLNNDSLQILFNKDIHIANWGRKQVEYALIEAEKRLISRLVKTASERYTDLLKNEPELLKRVKLSHLASYLGITQVSLSRIRSNVK